MSGSPYQEEFQRYLLTQPTLQAAFPARGKVGEELPAIIGSSPLGTVMLFPEYLVFLTLSTSDPGIGVIMSDFGRQFTRALVDQAFGIVADLAEMVASHFEKGKYAAQFREALANPYSMFIPLRTLTNVETGRHYTTTQYMRLTTSDLTYVFTKELESGLPWKQWGELVHDWHPEVVSYLRAAITRNEGAGAATHMPPQPAPMPTPLHPERAPLPQMAPPSQPLPSSPVSAIPVPAPAKATAGPSKRRRAGCVALVALLLLTAGAAGGIALAQSRSHYSSYSYSYSDGSSSAAATPTDTPIDDSIFDPISVDPPTATPTPRPTATSTPAPTIIARLLSGHYNVTYQGQRARSGDYFIWFDFSFTNNTNTTQSVYGSDMYLCLQSNHQQCWAMADSVDQGPFSVNPGYYLKDVQFAWVVPCSATSFRVTYNPDSSTNVYWNESSKGCAGL